MQWWTQADSQVRCEWAEPACALVAPGDIAVVVDVLSFTTCVSIATSRAIAVHPAPLPGEGEPVDLSEYVAQRGAVLAGKRSDGAEVSLSPASILAAEGVTSIVLPSPNGSRLSWLLQDRGATVIAGCVRNAGAVARHVAGLLEADPARSVVVIPAGERWPDGSLRPAVEDQLGAGAILHALSLAGYRNLSPEARVAAVGHSTLGLRAHALIADSASGRELRERGFGDDVELAAEADADDVVPVLGAGGYVAH